MYDVLAGEIVVIGTIVDPANATTVVGAPGSRWLLRPRRLLRPRPLLDARRASLSPPSLRSLAAPLLGVLSMAVLGLDPPTGPPAMPCCS